MEEQLNRFGVEVLASCLMTNHTHLIAVPGDSAILARAIGEAHRRCTRMKNFADGVQAYREISIMSPEFSEFCPTLKPAAG